MRFVSLILLCWQIVIKSLLFFLNHIHWLLVKELLSCTWNRAWLQTIDKSHWTLRVLIIRNSINIDI